jgi:hypothetical protein
MIGLQLDGGLRAPSPAAARSTRVEATSLSMRIDANALNHRETKQDVLFDRSETC